jgi:hypothetical protein
MVFLEAWPYRLDLCLLRNFTPIFKEFHDDHRYYVLLGPACSLTFLVNSFHDLDPYADCGPVSFGLKLP